jgi:glycosyltransferase involved in cell wall biosynthesis
LRRRETINGVDLIRVSAPGKKNRATGTLPSMFGYVASGALYTLFHIRALRETDIINTHFAVPTGPLGAFVRRVLAAPNILTIIGGDIYDPTKRLSPHRSRILRWVNRFVIDDADRVIAISADTRRRAQRYYRVRNRIRVINYGFEPPEGRTSAVTIDPDRNRYRLVAVGRLVQRKGFEYLIEALARLPASIELILIGDGPTEPDLRATAAKYAVSDRVVFTGYLTRELIHEHLRQADCFVLSSLHEGLGIVVQEAMYAGLPIVATNVGGQMDLLEERRNALLVRPRDANALSRAILRIYEDRQLADSLRRNNRADIEEYLMDNNSEEYLRLFDDVVVAAP